MRTISVIDSHTEGEPTRVVIEGAPNLGDGDAASRQEIFGDRFDRFRSAVVNEPRGSDALVGALLYPPVDSTAVAQVLFFNNVGVLQMCVHGTIGVAATLRHMGRIKGGRHRLETVAGDVWIDVQDDGLVAVENVLSYRHAAQVEVVTERHGSVRGDIAWGGNWFFLAEAGDRALSLDQVDSLTDYTWDIRQSLRTQGVSGADGAEIDHIELFGPPSRADADSKNFVLCPGKAYDRSPCGTGTSAKMACLAANGRLEEGQLWRQESIVGSVFVGSIRESQGGVIPTVRGRAFITAEARLLLDPDDPFRDGIRD